MDGFSRFAISVLFLVLLAVLYVGILTVLAWLLGKFLRWLLRQPMVNRQVSRMQRKLREWWMRYKAEVIQIWEFASEVLIDPLFFGYIIFALFNRIEFIIGYTKIYPQYSFWQILNLDMENDMNFYAWFLVIFFLWTAGKAWKHRQEVRRDRKIENVLVAIAKKLGIDESEYSGLSSKEETQNKGEHFDAVL